MRCWMSSQPTSLLIYKLVSILFLVRMPSFKSIFFFLMLGSSLMHGRLASAQGGGQNGARLGQLENAKIAFITNRVSLSQDQAQKFWPLYNEFSAKRRDLNRNGRLLRRDITENMTDQQIHDNIDQSFTIRQQELNLEKDYFDKFQKVITLRQVAQLLNAERDFTKEVIKRVANRPGAGGPAND